MTFFVLQKASRVQAAANLVAERKSIKFLIYLGRSYKSFPIHCIEIFANTSI